MKIYSTLLASLIAFVFPCQSVDFAANKDGPGEFRSPEKMYGELLHDVQMAKVFPVGKTFVDDVLNLSPEKISEQHKAEKSGKLRVREI